MVSSYLGVEPVCTSSWTLAWELWFLTIVYSSRHYFGPDVANNHHLSGETPCLQLLAEGEQMMIPEYDVPSDVVAEVTALLDANDLKPTCSTCYRMVKDGSHWYGLYLEKDVQVLAHHMQTK